MKKLMKIAVLLFVAVNTSLAQTATKDTVRHIELPAAIISQQEQQANISTSLQSQRKNDIKRLNQTKDLPFLLSQFSSVVVQSDAGTGTGYTSIRIRGTDLTRINVTMNGVPVNDPESQATYFVNTPDIAASCRSIDVTKGAGYSKNGNGSFGAAIGLNTLDVNSEKPTGSVNLDAGSFHTYKASAKISTGLIHQKWISTLRFSTIQSDGYVQRSASNLSSLQWTTKYTFKPGTTLIFNYLKGREKTGQAWNGVLQTEMDSNRRFNSLGLKRDGSFYTNQTDNYGQDYYQLFFDHSLNTNFSIGTTLFYTKGKGYYEEYKLDQEYENYHVARPVIGNDTLGTTDLIRQLWLDNDFIGGRFMINYFSEHTNAGLYLNYNFYQGRHIGKVIWAEQGIPENYEWYRLPAQKSDMNVYGMLEHRLSSKLHVVADVQVRSVRYQINGFRNNPDLNYDLHYQFFNPKANIEWAHHGWQSKMSVGWVGKEPNRDDIEADEANLPKPEKLFNVEWSVSKKMKQWGLSQVNLYGMFYKDQLVLTGKINDVGAYTRTNIPSSYRIGIEMEQIIRLRSRLLELSVNAAFSMNKINHFTEYQDDYDAGGQIKKEYNQTDISFSPNQVVGGRISISPFILLTQSKWAKCSLDILPKFVGQQFLDNTSNNARKLNAYFIKDVVITCPFTLKNTTVLQARIGLYNIYNAKYVSNGYTYSYRANQQENTFNYYFPQAGFHFMAGLGVDF
ncbi:MAG TPA: TonB-dependent receptor plug domain-containing protein [Chitinophagaceae bacterium]|nr:TonB-dependent receptor plug domain-containing protein [Chitinophagaceae bacterium]